MPGNEGKCKRKLNKLTFNSLFAIKEEKQMKKRVIVLICAMITMAMLLSGCGEKRTETTVGSYSLFCTEDVQEYLSFLENFDETKY